MWMCGPGPDGNAGSQTRDLTQFYRVIGGKPEKVSTRLNMISLPFRPKWADKWNQRLKIFLKENGRPGKHSPGRPPKWLRALRPTAFARSIRPLAEHRIEHFFVEAHDRGFAHAHRRSPQIPGRTEHFLDDFLERRALHVKGVELLALCHQNLGRFLSNGPRIRFAELPARRNLFFDHDFLGIQNLGRFRTARSTLAEIIPVDLFGHVQLLLDHRK